MRPDWTRALYGAAAALATVGLALRIVPLPVGIPDAPGVALPPPAEPVSGAVQAQALLAYEEIARADPFVPERVGRPPARHAPQRAGATGLHDGTTRLYGIATSPAGAVALIDADATIPGAEVYRVGDAVGGARIIAITDSSVVLQDSKQRRVLTLPATTRRAP